MRPKKQRPIKFNNNCHAVFDSKDLAAAIYAQTEKPVCKIKSVFMYGCYPAISIYGAKYHIHRLIAGYRLGRKLNRNESAHHIDDNPLNALWENLKVIYQGDHIRCHLKGKKQSPEFAFRRTSASCLSRYGHPRIHENPELLNPSP